MSRLPKALSQWAGLPSSNPVSTTTPTLTAPRLACVLQQTFPADQTASVGSVRSPAAGNPRIAPYAALPPVTSLSDEPRPDQQFHTSELSGSTARHQQHSQQLQLQQQHVRHKSHALDGMQPQQKQGKRQAKQHGSISHAGAKGKRTKMHSANIRRPKSARPDGLGPAADEGAVAADKDSCKLKARARSVSPNSHYHVSSTSSVPEDAAAWIAATISLSPRQAQLST